MKCQYRNSTVPQFGILVWPQLKSEEFSPILSKIGEIWWRRIDSRYTLITSKPYLPNRMWWNSYLSREKHILGTRPVLTKLLMNILQSLFGWGFLISRMIRTFIFCIMYLRSPLPTNLKKDRTIILRHFVNPIDST